MGSLVTIEIPPGEALDRLTILNIKLKRISDPVKLAEVKKARGKVLIAIGRCVPDVYELKKPFKGLKKANRAIWDAEETLRRADAANDEILDAIRVVTQNNDKRAELKRDIDRLLDVDYTEVKSYDLSQNI